MKNHPIYEINKFNYNTLIEDVFINTFKTHLLTNSFIEKSHSHNFYLLVLFTEGSGKHTIDFKTYKIKPGAFFLLQPGQIHSWKLSSDIEGYILFYTSEFYNLHFAKKRVDHYSFFNSTKSNPEIKLETEEIKTISNYFQQILEENKAQNLYKKDKITLLLDMLLIELARKYRFTETHLSSSYQNRIEQFENILEMHFKNEKSPSFYASKLNISLKHLNRVCKEVLNQTVTETIRKRIILESKRMLVLKKYTISEIADELNFESHSYFAEIFKKQTGISPKEFVKKN